MKKYVVLLTTLLIMTSLMGCGQKAYVDYSDVAPTTQYENGSSQVSPYNTPNANKSNSDNAEATEDSSQQGLPGFGEQIELVDEGTATETASTTTGTDISISNEESLDLVEYGCKARTPSEDDPEVYIDYCGVVTNPNQNLLAQYPEVIITLKSGTGSIIATDSVMAPSIAPNDTITLCGIVKIKKVDKTPDMEVHFDLDWGDLVVADANTPKSTDFKVSNISERAGSNDGLITGEVTNNSTKDAENICLSLILRKAGKIVYIDTEYVDKLTVGNKKAFQFSCLGGWPEHDVVEITAQPW